MRRAVTALLAGVTLACGTIGCGSGSANGPVHGEANLLLDFAPNAIHSGIYSAVARTYDRGEGIQLHVRAPGAGADSVKLLESGRADFALLDIHDLAIGRERGHDIVGIMAIVQRPLASLIAAPAYSSPRRLQGQTVGVTGLPSDEAVLRSIVTGARGDPRKVKRVSVGFNAVSSLLARRVAGATAFWNDEGVTLAMRHPGFHVFRVDSFGAPSYPELVLCATRASLRDDPERARAVVRAIVRGYGVTLTDPEGSAADLESLVPGLDPKLVAAQLSAEQPAFLAPDGAFGELDLTRLGAWARWEAAFGVVKRPPDVARTFDPSFLAGTRRLLGS